MKHTNTKTNRVLNIIVKLYAGFLCTLIILGSLNLVIQMLTGNTPNIIL